VAGAEGEGESSGEVRGKGTVPDSGTD